MGEFLFRFLMILTIPAMAIPPEVPPPIIQVLETPNLKARLDEGLISYDEVLQLIEAIENEDIEDHCTPEQIEEIAQFVTMLAEKGTDPKIPSRIAPRGYLRPSERNKVAVLLRRTRFVGLVFY